MRSVILLIISIMLPILLIGVSAAQVVTNAVSYYVVYDPIEGSGIIEVNASIALERPDWVVIPVAIFGDQAKINLLNYSWKGLLVGGVNFDKESGNVYAYIVGDGLLTMYFSADDLFDEAGLGAYVALIDTTDLAGLARSVNVEILLPGEFNIESVLTKKNATFSVSKENNCTIINISGFTQLFIIASIKMVEAPSTTPQPLQTSLIVLIVVLVGGAISLVVLYYIKKRSRVLIERVDYLYDDISRAILKVLGEAGGLGLTQAEIVKATGLPKSSISRRVKRLEEDGIVVIKRVGKYNYISLTSRGLDLYKKITKDYSGGE